MAARREPVTLVDAIEAGADRLTDVRVHEMLTLHDRPSIRGEVDGVRHVVLVPLPDHPAGLRARHLRPRPERVQRGPAPDANHDEAVAGGRIAASPPDRHGYFSLGVTATYIADLIDDAPFFIEANRQMPRTFGENQVHVSEILGWAEADYAPFEIPAPPHDERDAKIADLVAERIPDGATLQAGIGSIPNEILSRLGDHRDLGIHTELLTEAVVDLVEAARVTGTRKQTHRNKIIATAAGGTRRLYDYVADNPGVEFWPVSYTNDPRVIGREDDMRAINATLEVDFLGQCASESLGSRLLVLVRGTAGLRPRLAVLERRRLFHRPALGDLGRVHLPDRPQPPPGRRGHLDQERRRLRGHRARRRRAPRQLDPGANPEADRDRASEVPRPARARGRRARLHLRGAVRTAAILAGVAAAVAVAAVAAVAVWSHHRGQGVVPDRIQGAIHNAVPDRRPAARTPVAQARCPADVAGCREVSGRVVYVEPVDPDGDGDAHFVLADTAGITEPGLTFVDVRFGLRPHPLPTAGEEVTAAGPVETGSFGQRQIAAVAVETAG